MKNRNSWLRSAAFRRWKAWVNFIAQAESAVRGGQFCDDVCSQQVVSQGCIYGVVRLFKTDRREEVFSSFDNGQFCSR